MPLTRFIGRGAALAEIDELLASTRLLTITGAGGSGKTRLALEAAARGAAAAGGSVAWIELATVVSSDLVPQQVAAGLGLREEGGRAAFDALLAFVRDRSLLLVLDNCEHLVDACADLAATLLRAAPGVRILATSREPLGVAGERAWLIPALSLPDAVAGTAEPAAYEAVELFVERARDVAPTFALTEANAAAVVQICRRLDGLPLAIELAAARVRVLPPEQLAAKLDDAFHALGTGHRTALPRHRTLRAVMDWSHGLLTEQERILLRRLSVFDGGFDLDAAEAVCRGGSIEAADILDLVAALVDRSLVAMSERDGRARYRLLETVRQYAAERLSAAGEEHDLRSRHASHFVDLAAAAEPHLITVARRARVEALQRDTDNLRQALAWTREHTPHAHIRLAGMLCWFWFSTRDWLEGRRWLEAALALPEAAAPTRERAAALFAAGALASLQAQTGPAAAWLQESAELAGRLGDARLEAYARNYLGMAFIQAGRPEGEAPVAAALAWYREAGDLYGMRLSMLLLGTLALARGDLERAHELTTEGVRIARLFGVNRELGVALQMHAGIALARGDLAAAAVTVRESLAALRSDPMYLFIARGIDLLAQIRFAEGAAREAVVLCGAAAAIRATLGAEAFTVDRGRTEAMLAAARERLGDDVVASILAGGATVDLEQALALAMGASADAETAPSADTVAGPSPAAAAPSPPPSTANEADPVAASLRVRALGGLVVEDAAGRAVTWAYARPRELLVLLLCHTEGRTREQIGVALWPEASAAQVKNSFHVTLHHLRRTLGRTDIVRFERDRYRIDPDASVWFDAAAFEATATAALRGVRRGDAPVDALRAALALYRGHFLAGVNAGDWHLTMHDRLQRLCVDAHVALGALLMERRAWAEAAVTWERLIQLDELHEAAHRQLMRCLAETGERGRALRYYDRLVALLRDELDAEPESATTHLAERLRGGAASPRHPAAPA